MNQKKERKGQQVHCFHNLIPKILQISNHCKFETTNRNTLSRQKYLLLDGADGLARVEALGAGLSAVHDGVAAVQLERVVQLGQALGSALVTTVLNPSAEK